MILSRRAVQEDPADGILILCFLLFMFIMGLAFLLPASRRPISSPTGTYIASPAFPSEIHPGSDLVIVETSGPNSTIPPPASTPATGRKVTEEANDDTSGNKTAASEEDDREVRRQMSQALAERLEHLKAFLRVMTSGWLGPTGQLVHITSSSMDNGDQMVAEEEGTTGGAGGRVAGAAAA